MSSKSTEAHSRRENKKKIKTIRIKNASYSSIGEDIEDKSNL